MTLAHSEWRLLLIDQEEDEYVLARAMLGQSPGCTTRLDWAPTYTAGLQRLNAGGYDAALIAYDLGPQTGIELIRELSGQNYPAPLILYSGRGSYLVDLEAMQAGATLYLDKSEITPSLLERSIRYAIDRKQVEQRLQSLNRTLRALSNSNQALAQAKDEASFLQEACRIVVDDCGYAMVWIGYAEEDENQTVRPVAYAGFELGYLESLGITWGDTERGRGPTGMAVRTGQVCLCRDMLTDPAFLPWREQALTRGYASSIALPMMSGGKAFGVLTIYASQPDAFSTQEVKLLTELANDLTNGILTLRVRAGQQRAEAELRRQQEWLRVTLTSIGDGVIATDASGQVTFLNPVAAALTGWTAEEAAGQPVQQVFRILNEKNRKTAEDVVRRALREKRTIALENNTELLTRDGRRLPIEDSAAPILDTSGDIVGVVLVFHEVTEKRRAQETLRKSEERYRQLFNNMSEGFAVHEIITDENGRPCDYRFLDINPAFERLTGLKRTEVIGKRVYELLPDNDSYWIEIYGQVALTGEAAHFENYATALGRWFEVFAYQPLPRQFAVIFVDVTARKLAAEKQAYLASFPEQNPNPVIEVDLEGSLLYANPASLRQFPGLVELGTAHPFLADWPAVVGPFREGQVSSSVREIRLGDDYYQQALAYRANEGLVRIYALNVTQRRRAEEALRESELRFRLALQNTPVVVATLDPNLCYTWIYNPKGGFNPEDILGKPVGVSTAPEATRKIVESLQEVLTKGNAASWEIATQTKIGEMFFESHAEPLRDVDGQITGIGLVSIDITERKRAEQMLQAANAALEESAARLKRAQEIAHLGSWELDLVKNTLSWSNEVYRIFGLQPQEFSATYEAFLEAVHPDDRAAVDDAYSSSIREGRETYEIEHRIVRKTNGEVRIVSEKCEHTRDGTGRILRSIGMVHDITERKLAEAALIDQNEQLQKYAEQLRRSNQALEDFAFIASHDLQEPLRKVQGFGEILKTRYRQVIDADGQSYLDRMIAASDRMQSMLTGLLEYSRVTAQGQPFIKVDLQQILSEVISDLEVRLLQTKGQVKFDTLPAIQADPLQMRQLIQNLIGNGLKFHRAGVPPVIKVSAELLPGGALVLAVADNGIGFDMKYANQLFKPFHRLHSRSEYPGSGIGLAICSKIVERHGGTITVDSAPGEGSTFVVTLPVS